MKPLPLLVLATLFLGSCNMSDDSHDLGGGFSYIGEGGDSHYIIGGNISHNTIVYGNVLKYNSNDEFIIIEQEPNYEEYKNKVGFDLGGDYYSYHAFINDSIKYKKEQTEKQISEIKEFSPLYSVLKAREVTFDNSETDIAKCETFADSLLKTQPYYQSIFRRKRNYWIIDKKLNVGYGPVDSLHFTQQCKRLGITLELEAHY